ncbi:MAG: hypothetical protein ACI9CE_003174 [Flavobacterium sp.]|jgi:hypothetical protein
MKSSSLDLLLKDPVAVVCHDAGATNIIINWLKVMPKITVRVHLSGPAKELWYRAYPDTINHSLDDALQGAAMLLSGTGWASDLEYDARNIASSKGIFSVGVVDHWVNYESRFIRGGRAVYPNEIWVVDEFGYSLASENFPSVRIRLLPNCYLDEQVRLIKSLQKDSSVNPYVVNILYALEPIRVVWREGEASSGEFQALDYFLANLHKITAGSICIKLRLHPSDRPSKYFDWVNRQSPDITLEISEGRSLAEDVAWSNIVIGCQTYVLIIALSAGKRVVSSLPPYAPASLIPYPGIEELREKLDGSI